MSNSVSGIRFLLFAFYFNCVDALDRRGDADVRVIWTCRLGTVNHFWTAGQHVSLPGTRAVVIVGLSRISEESQFLLPGRVE